MKTVRLFGIFCLFVILLSAAVYAQDWYQQDSNADGYELLAVDAATENRVVAVGAPTFPSRGIIVRTLDGEDWETVLEYDAALETVCAFDGNTFLAAGGSDHLTLYDGPAILKSSDWGGTWDPKNSTLSEGFINGIACVGSTAYAVGGLSQRVDDSIENVVLKSTDRGDTWEAIIVDVNIVTAEGVYFVSEDLGYVVGASGYILKTTDGSNFDAVARIQRGSPAIAIGLNDIYCVDANTCWVVGSGEYVYKTTNGGSNWTEHDTGGTTAGFHTVYFEDANTGWIGGQNMIRKTTDGGLTWNISRADISSESSGHLPVAFIEGIDFSGDVGYAVGGAPTGDTAGLVLRLGEPSPVYIVDEPNLTREPEPSATPHRTPTELNLTPEQPDCIDLMIDCEVGYYAVFEYDDEGCVESYECRQAGMECIYEYSDCIDEANGIIEECIPHASEPECSSWYEGNRQACFDAYNECLGLTDTDDEEDAGVLPNSPFWGIDKFFENVDLFLTTDKAEQAKKRLEFAKERMLEIKAMVQENQMEAAQNAKSDHDTLMQEVGVNIGEIEDKGKAAEVQAALEKYQASFTKNVGELKVQEMNQEQQQVMTSLEKGYEDTKNIKSQLKVKTQVTVEQQTQEQTRALAAIVNASDYTSTLLKDLNQYDPLPADLESVQADADKAEANRVKAQNAYDIGDYMEAEQYANKAGPAAQSALAELRRYQSRQMTAKGVDTEENETTGQQHKVGQETEEEEETTPIKVVDTTPTKVVDDTEEENQTTTKVTKNDTENTTPSKTPVKSPWSK